MRRFFRASCNWKFLRLNKKFLGIMELDINKDYDKD